MKRLILLIVLLVGILCQVNAQDRLYPVANDAPSYHNPYYANSHTFDKSVFDDFVIRIWSVHLPTTYVFYDDVTSSLVVRVLPGPFCGTEKDVDTKYTEFRCKITQTIATRYKQLFYSAVMSSSDLEKPSWVMGWGRGCVCTLYYGYCVAECKSFSEEQESNCQQLIALINKLVGAVKENSLSDIDSMIIKVDELTKAFESLFPEDIKEHYWAYRSDETKSFIAYMYNNKLYEDYDFLQRYCSEKLLKKLEDACPYDADCVAYATWLFRSGEQDYKPGSKGESVMLNVKSDGDWYVYAALDMGWEFTNKIRITNNDGKILIDDVYAIE